MSRFIKQFLYFAAFVIVVLILICFLPPTPVAKKSLYMSSLLKDQMLARDDTSRIIFIGGSNLCFGLNSGEIKDSLQLHPINTSVNAGIGLVYMINQVSKFIKKGDKIIVVAEYQQFFDNFAYGNDGDELIKTIFDKRPIQLNLLELKQLFYLVRQIPKYAISKFDPAEYRIKQGVKYPIDCFNEYGDVTIHWTLNKQYFKTQKSVGENLNWAIIDKLTKFNDFVLSNDAALYLSFPGYQLASFNNSEEKINQIETILRKTNIPILGSARRYIMADSLLFDTPYHLNKKGVDLRTRLLIDDYKHYIK